MHLIFSCFDRVKVFLAACCMTEYLNPFTSKTDLISNSPNYLPYNSYDVSSENLVLDQLIIP